MRSGLGPAPEPGSRRDSHGPAGGDRPHRLDEVVDVRVERGEVAAGAGGDPSAEGRELERLREVAQGQPCSRSWSSSAGPSAPAWIRAARETSVDLDRPDRARRGRSSPRRDRRRRSAARRRRPRWCRRRTGSRPGPSSAHHVEHLLDLGLVTRAGDEVGRVVDLAAEAADDVAVGLAERVGDALVGGRWRDARGRPAARAAAPRSSIASSGTGSSTSSAPKPELLAHPRGGRLQARRGPAAGRRTPSPSAFSCAPRWPRANASASAHGRGSPRIV